VTPKSNERGQGVPIGIKGMHYEAEKHELGSEATANTRANLLLLYRTYHLHAPAGLGNCPTTPFCLSAFPLFIFERASSSHRRTAKCSNLQYVTNQKKIANEQNLEPHPLTCEYSTHLGDREQKMDADSEFHLRAASDAARPRIKPPPHLAAISAPFSYTPSDDGTDENLLILLHGLGSRTPPFFALFVIFHI
jgi:hypothetical protein